MTTRKTARAQYLRRAETSRSRLAIERKAPDSPQRCRPRAHVSRAPLAPSCHRSCPRTHGLRLKRRTMC
eukprot:6211519-Pleurochrysis_carterae.AAC.3